MMIRHERASAPVSYINICLVCWPFSFDLFEAGLVKIENGFKVPSPWICVCLVLPNVSIAFCTNTSLKTARRNVFYHPQYLEFNLKTTDQGMSVPAEMSSNCTIPYRGQRDLIEAKT
jgi:hypothetical protein